MTDGYGRSSEGSYASYDRDTSSWRTYQGCLFEEWETFSETFPPSGMMRSGALFPLPQWVLPTSEKGSSSLPTPTAQDAKNDGGPSQFRRNSLPLNALVKMWHTPLASDYKNMDSSNQESLSNQVKKWPTPSATPRGAHTGTEAGEVSADGKSRTSAKGVKFGATLQTAVGSGQLNPTWVEWLMGFPLGWTDLKDSETP